MPYIDEQSKILLGNGIRDPKSVGELNFVITTLIDEFISKKGLKYETLNAMIGVLECAKMELYRRICAPYEDKKIIENGDVYFEEHTK